MVASPAPHLQGVPMTVLVMTVDQRSSRRGPDLVSALLPRTGPGLPPCGCRSSARPATRSRAFSMILRACPRRGRLAAPPRRRVADRHRRRQRRGTPPRPATRAGRGPAFVAAPERRSPPRAQARGPAGPRAVNGDDPRAPRSAFSIDTVAVGGDPFRPAYREGMGGRRPRRRGPLLLRGRSEARHQPVRGQPARPRRQRGRGQPGRPSGRSTARRGVEGDGE